MFPRTTAGTWMHSIALVAAGAGLLAIAARAVAFAPVDAPPLRTLATLLPALAIGFVSRRHPLLVGAAASLLASLLARAGTGDAVATALVVAVAALAGRALRHRCAAAN